MLIFSHQSILANVLADQKTCLIETVLKGTHSICFLIEIRKFVLFCLIFNIQVNSYGHVGMVSSPNHTFFLSKLD